MAHHPANVRDLAVMAAALLAFVLLAAAASDAWSARRLSHALAEGQGTLVRAALVRALPPDAATDDAALDRVRADLGQLGVTWIGALDAGGAVTAESGRRTVAIDPLPPPGQVRHDGPRLLGWLGPEPGARRHATAVDGPGLPPDAPLPPGSAPLTAGSRIAYELEPMLAQELRGQATRSVLLALAVALALVLGALALRRSLVRAEVLEASLARDRHLAALGTMSAVLAHELRNPLASLKGNAQLLVEVLDEQPRVRDRAAWVVEEARRMERLTTDLLDFARSGGVRPESADPADVLRSAAREACPDARVHLDAAPAAWTLDPVRVHQALSNLLKNAAQACADPPPEATVTVAAQALCYTVRDHGDGLPDDLDATQLFEPFRTTKTRGTGLGLAVVARVASLHGGRVEARNHPDGGAEFRLFLARSPDA